MRKFSLVVLAVLLAVAMLAVACGSGGSSSAKSPQELLSAASTTAQDTNTQSGTYELTLTVDADAGQIPPELQFIAGQPITVAGDFASQADPLRLDLSAQLSLMGAGIQAGLRVVDDKAWLNLLGQWYETPPEVDQQLAQAKADISVQEIQTVMDDTGVDWTTWLKDLKEVGEETVADTQVKHLTATLDVQKMLADVSTLLQSQQVMDLLNLVGSTEEAAMTDVSLPTPEEVDQLVTVVEQMIQGANLDFWVAKADDSLRKLVVDLDLVLPEDDAGLGLTGGELSGLNGLNMLLTMNLAAPDQGVSVEAPASTKSFDDLQQDLLQNPLFGGLLEGLMGSGL